MVFLLSCLKKKETIRKKEIDLHVNIEVDEPVHVNTKKRSIAERKLDLLIKCMEAIVTRKIKRQELKASPFSIHVKEKLNGLDKHRRTFAEKRVWDVLFDVEMSNEIENRRYAVNVCTFYLELRITQLKTFRTNIVISHAIQNLQGLSLVCFKIKKTKHLFYFADIL